MLGILLPEDVHASFLHHSKQAWAVLAPHHVPYILKQQPSSFQCNVARLMQAWAMHGCSYVMPGLRRFLSAHETDQTEGKKGKVSGCHDAGVMHDHVVHAGQVCRPCTEACHAIGIAFAACCDACCARGIPCVLQPGAPLMWVHHHPEPLAAEGGRGNHKTTALHGSQ